MKTIGMTDDLKGKNLNLHLYNCLEMVNLNKHGVLTHIAFCFVFSHFVFSFFSLLCCVLIISHSFLLSFIPSPLQDMYSICHMIMLRHVRRCLASWRTIT